ncbi:cysteine hydrolase [Phormidium tenue FACHB-886]|nr:cysteine hydrolase [Phormidium tenue FACHB-886]
MTADLAKFDPSTTALLVVDIQNDFCHPDGICGQAGYPVTETWNAVEGARKLLKAARATGSLIVHIFLRVDWQNDSEVWLSQLLRLKQPGLCTPNSFGEAPYTGVEPLPGEPIIYKPRYSGFVNTPLEALLREHGIHTLVVCGVATNICVESTVRDGFMRDFEVVIVSDASGAYSESMHQAALEVMHLAFGIVVSADDLVNVWQPAQVATA